MANTNKRKETEAAAIQKGRKLKVNAAPTREDDDDEMEEDVQTVKKKKKKKQKAPLTGLLIAGGVGLALLLLIVVGGTAFYFISSSNAKNGGAADKVAAAKGKNEGGGAAVDLNAPPPEVRGGVPIVPGIKEGNPALKPGGDRITKGVRGAIYRTERQNELKQIGTFFVQFADSTPRSERTKDAFLSYIRGDSKAIHDAIAEGYYVMNMKAELSSNSIVAYEGQMDGGNHLCVHGDTSVRYVPLQTLKDSLPK